MLISTPKVIKFLPDLLATQKALNLSDPKPYPEYMYLSKSAFFTKLTAPNK